MDTKHIIKYIPIILCLTIILFFSIALFKNINYVKVPNSDFFQYIEEGHWYPKFKLPKNIGAPPFTPALICFLSKIFHSISYPELFSAHLINIIFSIFILTNIFIILYQKNKPWIGLATILLLATNKTYVTTSLNVTSEIPYAFFITLTILLYSQKKYKLAYFLSGLAFLSRYEAIVLPIVIFSLEFFRKTKRFKFSNPLIAFLPIIIWLIILNFHSEGGTSIFQNHYITEIIAGKSDIPNPQPKNSLIEILLSNPVNFFFYRTFNLNNYPAIPIEITDIIFPIIVFLLCLIKIIPKKNAISTKIISSILIAHTIFLSAFPNFSIRYMFPIFWILYLIIIDRKNKFIAIILTIILLIINLKTINNYSPYDMIYEKSESRLVANWINQQNFDQPTHIITYEPYVISYFVDQKPYITLDYWWDSDPCVKDTICLLDKINKSNPEKSQIIFITTSYSSPSDISAIDDQYLFQKNHMILFREQNIIIKYRKQLKLITELKLKEDNSHWARIYQYQPN